MGFNLQGAAQVPLSVFGGRVSEMAAQNVPEGASPDNQEVVFRPGSVDSRPGLKRVFSSPFTGGTSTPTVSWSKSYVLPNGDIQNLYLDSNGTLWMEDLTHTPGGAIQIGQVTPNSYAKSTTAFGREYIAISDGLHGSDMALQWDGITLSRVTQEGPGQPPAVSSIALPAVSMQPTGTPPTFAIQEIDSGGGAGQLRVFTAPGASLANLTIGDMLTISGNGVAAYNVSAPVVAIYASTPPGPGLILVSYLTPASTPFGLGGIATTGTGVTAQRANNIVTIATVAAHNLKVGYQVQITGLPAVEVGSGVGGGGGIANIVINNENAPGIATVITNQPHGLVPGVFVSITGVTPSASGGTITGVSRVGGVVSVTTYYPHGVTPGSLVSLSGVSDATFDTTAVVSGVLSPTTFIFPQTETTDASSSGGAVRLNWPVPDTATPTLYEVLSAPTPTTFQVQVYYADGVWIGGSVKYSWDGTFFVSAILSDTSFQYQQYGPDAISTDIGTVTPWGQAAPGKHQCQVLFLTGNGYLTRPSPPVSFVANGGQYISVGAIPRGPDNVVARILAFTGADGAYFFYIPAPAQINGQQVSTATQINDNFTDSVLLDFSDNTLFASLSISTPGNEVANQIVIDGALGFGSYASRLLTWGQRNQIQNLLNMGFEGGYVYSGLYNNPMPTGWTDEKTGNGFIAGAGRFGGTSWGMRVTGYGLSGELSQSMYLDAYGAPIAQPNTAYRFRCWLQPSTSSGLRFAVYIQSASTGFTSFVEFDASSLPASGAFVEAPFSDKMPPSIPPDLRLYIYGRGAVATLYVDEMSIIYDENPYTDKIVSESYVNNPEAFDGVTGKFGATDDARKVMDMGEIRKALYFFTRDPGGRIHRTQDNGTTEPSGWQVDEMAANCGLISAFALAKSQADSSTSSGGEEWLAWQSSSGARIFAGSEPWKISQEIEPDWPKWTGINSEAYARAWTLNDPVERRIYFGVTQATLMFNVYAPNTILVMDYRELETASQIASSPPIHTSYTGRLIATDHTRKWTIWRRAMNGAALMFRDPEQMQAVFFNGNAFPLGYNPGFGNCYTLDPAKLTDDDYGLIEPYYTTYFFVTRDQEGALTYQTEKGREPLGGGRKLLAYLACFVSGTGRLTITALCDVLTNPWPLNCVRPLAATPTFDLEWTGGSAQGQRIALRFASSPLLGQTDNSFSLQKVLVALRAASHLPVRGAA